MRSTFSLEPPNRRDAAEWLWFSEFDKQLDEVEAVTSTVSDLR